MPVRTIAGIIAGVVALFLFFTITFGSWYTIDQGERGILLTNGSVADIVGPGLHFKTPWFQSVKTISTRQQVARWSCQPNKDCQSNTPGQIVSYVMQAYSSDQQPADMTVSVNYHINDADVSKIYSNYGGLEGVASQIIFRVVPQQVKTVFGKFDAVSVIQDRATFNAQVFETIAKSVPAGTVTIDSAQVEDIAFSTAYEQAVEQRMTAQVAVQKQEQQLETEKVNATIALTQATGRANSVKAEADATAYQTKVNADANAYATTVNGQALATAIKTQSDALTESPRYVEFVEAQRWNGILPTTMVPGSAVPFINVGPATATGGLAVK